MFQNMVWYSLELIFMNNLHVYCDLWQTVLPCRVTISHTLWLLLMGAHEGHGVQADTAVKRSTIAVNHGIVWLQNGEWWSYRSDRQKVTFEMYIIMHTWWGKSFLNSYQCTLPPFRGQSSTKKSLIPRPSGNRSQPSSPAKNAVKPVFTASMHPSHSVPYLQHTGTPMTPIPQTAQTSR
jgi:hypothetical protein